MKGWTPDQEESCEQLVRWWDRPSTFVREQFDVELDDFQEEALDLFPYCPRLAMRASKGPGVPVTLTKNTSWPAVVHGVIGSGGGAGALAGNQGKRAAGWGWDEGCGGVSEDYKYIGWGGREA